jgi:hypothetical protein
MKEEDAPGCGRENDLIAFLYDELNDVEMRSFQRHVHDCSGCSAELASFREVRESVVAWRNESLRGVTSSNMVADSMVTPLRQRRPSATAALREFFNLSPLWMKGAVAFASLLFCLFAVLSVARWRDTSQPSTAGNNDNKLYTQQQVNSLVEQRVQEELQRSKSSKEQTPDSSVANNNVSQKNASKRIVNRGGELAKVSRVPRARRPLTRDEREQLAADLRLISSKKDTDIDLLSDGINQ